MYPAMGNHGFLRNDVAHPHFHELAAGSRRQRSGSLPARIRTAALGTASLTLPSTWYAFDAGRTRIYVLQAAWSDSNGGVNDTRTRSTPPTNGRRAAPSTSGSSRTSLPIRTRSRWLRSTTRCIPTRSTRNVGHLPARSGLAAGPQPVRREAGLQRPRAHLSAQLRRSGRHCRAITGGGGAKTQSVAEDPCLAIDAYAIGWSNSSNTGNACGAATPPSSSSR